MKNVFYVLFTFVFCIAVTNAQNFKLNKCVADRVTKLPLGNVSIYNNKDNSTTNDEGAFVFVSSINEINFNLMGYEGMQSTIDKLEKRDTIFLQPKAIQLDEIVVSNLEPFMKKVFDRMVSNYVQNYTVNFFLRNVFKKGNAITVLQDIHGKRQKDSSLKNSYAIEILDMRKTSFFEKKDQVDFKFPDFQEFFNGLQPVLDKNIFTEVKYNDNEFRKILFEAKDKNANGQTTKGYLIINRKDYAIVESFISVCDNPDVVPFKKLTLSSIKYRTTFYEKLLKFQKNTSLNKYYLSLSQLSANVEVVPDKKKNEAFFYNVVIDYFTTSAITNNKVASNFEVDKDIFKAKFPYSAEFWNNQNQLPLTNELKDFLKRVSENKDKKKEFEIIGNF